MISGLYSAASGMTNQIHRQNVIADNVANGNTSGYKKRCATFAEFLGHALKRQSALEPQREPVVSYLAGGACLSSIEADFSAGHVERTDSDYDLAIVGEGLFVVETPGGELYTRNGNFYPGPDGYLVTGDGFKVLGDGGAIRIPETGFEVSEEAIINQDKEGEQQIRIVRFDSPELLRKVGHNLYALSAQGANRAQESENMRVFQGYLERSNINVVREMVDLIDAARQYEANQKMIQSLDQTLERAVNEVGRVGG